MINRVFKEQMMSFIRNNSSVLSEGVYTLFDASVGKLRDHSEIQANRKKRASFAYNWNILNVSATSSRAAAFCGLRNGGYFLMRYAIHVPSEKITDPNQQWAYVYRGTAFECMN
jgi:hypothetical protein